MNKDNRGLIIINEVVELTQTNADGNLKYSILIKQHFSYYGSKCISPEFSKYNILCLSRQQ